MGARGPQPGTRGQIVDHPQRPAIELGLARKVPLRVLARKFGVSTSSLARHRRLYMPPQLKAALRVSTTPTDIDLDEMRRTESEQPLQHILAMRGRLYMLLDEAERFGDVHGAVRVHGRINANLEFTAKLLGDLNTGDQHLHLHLTSTPEYLRLRHMLIRALADHPEAMAAVASALRDVEAPADQIDGIVCAE